MIRSDPRLTALWFADLVGYSALASSDEGAALELVEAFQAAAREAVAAHGGRIVKFLGDGGLAAFPSAAAAVRSACALRDELAGELDRGADGGRVRVGVHVGEVTEAADGDLYGDGVNMAARIQAAAEPGEVVASEDVWRLLRARSEVDFEALGERQLKGAAGPIALYRVAAAGRAASPEGLLDRRTAPAARRPFGRTLAVGGLGLAVALVGVWIASRVVGAGSAGPDPADGGSGEAAPVARAQSIAVLPFDNLTPGGEDLLADGLTEDLIARLAMVPDLKVISGTSAMQFRGTDLSIREIGRALDAEAILEGSVRQADGRIRVVAQLVHAPTDGHLWAASYDREMADLLDLQSELADEIAGALTMRLEEGRRERMTARPTGDVEAYRHYLRGRQLVERRTAEDVQRAVASFQLAIDRDPTFARAYAGLSMAYSLLPFYAGYEDRPSYQRGREAAERAVELDPDLGEAHAALGFALLYLWEWDAAEAAFLRAVDLEPGNATAHQWYADYLASVGRLQEAHDHMGRAFELDPLSRIIGTELGWVHYLMRDYPRAIEVYEEVIAYDPEFPLVWLYLAWTHEMTGDFEAAIAALREHARIVGLEAPWLDDIEAGLEARGPRGYWEAVWATAGELPLPRGNRVAVLAQLGRNDDAFRIVDAMVEEGDDDLCVVKVAPHWDPLRDDPRFDRLLARIGLSS